MDPKAVLADHNDHLVIIRAHLDGLPDGVCQQILFETILVCQDFGLVVEPIAPSSMAVRNRIVFLLVALTQHLGLD